MDFITDFAQRFSEYFVWIGIISGVVFALSLLLVPYLLGRIDAAYFVALKPRKNNRNVWQFLGFIGKNIVGSVLVLMGLIMLVTPGQGVISIVLGLFLMEFPGKRNLELKLIQSDGVFKALNWLRAKAGKPPFQRQK